MAGIYRKHHGLDDVILLNENGLLCEASGSNVFIWYRDTLYTPALSEGCVDGVMRRIVMEVARENDIDVIEAQINPEILNEAEELFLTNAVHGMQWVLGYQKKRFFNKLSKDLHAKIVQWQLDKLD
jgi:branched-chain amino acid aminotransferase